MGFRSAPDLRGSSGWWEVLSARLWPRTCARGGDCGRRGNWGTERFVAQPESLSRAWRSGIGTGHRAPAHPRTLLLLLTLH